MKYELKYTGEEMDALLDKVPLKNDKFQHTIMPEPNIDYIGKVYQYIGITDQSYSRGFIYTCVEDENNAGEYLWVTTFVRPKVAQTITLSKSSVSLSTSSLTSTVTASTSGDGALSVKSSNTSVVTATISNGTITITAVANGSATVTVTAAESNSYLTATASISVSVLLVNSTLDNNSWATISAVSAAGNASSYWKVGDCKKVRLNGTVGTLALSNVDLYVFILGFNHNSSVEGTGISFGCFKTAKTDGKDVCLVDSYYAKNDSNVYQGKKCFNMNHWGNSSDTYNHGGWKGCDLRYDVLGSTNVAPSGYGAAVASGRTGYDATSAAKTSPVANTLMAALPSDLRTVLKPITKYTDNTGYGSTSASNVTSSVDYLPLMTEFELQGTITNSNSNEKNKQQQYQYYKNGNSLKKYKHSATTTGSSYWCRSPNAKKSGTTTQTMFCCHYQLSSSDLQSDSLARIPIGLASVFLV